MTSEFDFGAHFNVEQTGDITPYMACKLVNSAFKAMGIDRELPAPMFYTYVKNGYIGGVKNAKRCTRAHVAVWFERYFIKHYVNS